MAWDAHMEEMRGFTQNWKTVFSWLVCMCVSECLGWTLGKG